MAIRKPTAPADKSAAMAEILASAGQETKFRNGNLVEGTVSAIKDDDVYVDIGYKSVGQIRDGWSMVQNKEGRYNYVSPAGNLMTTKWFDSANEFSSGLALITRDGVTAKINNKGKVLDVLNQDKSNGMGGPGKN